MCVLTEPTTDAWMQSVASEMKHSETAFCVRLKDGSFELRWFTPEGEVRLCGHATLAAAHVLWEEGWLEHRKTARFSTLSGELTAAPSGRVIELNFPSRPPSEVEAPAGLLDALGVTPSWVGRDLDDYVVLLADEAAVVDCSPDFGALRAVETRGVIITAPAAQEKVDFVSRFFRAPIRRRRGPRHGLRALLPHHRSGRAASTRGVLAARQLSSRGGRARGGTRGRPRQASRNLRHHPTWQPDGVCPRHLVLVKPLDLSR